MKKYQRQKITDDKILSLAGMISAIFIGFRLLLLNSGDKGRNSAGVVRFWPY
jgi:hypothetical protein